MKFFAGFRSDPFFFQLRRGESPHVEIVVDKDRGVIRAPFLGRQVDLSLA